MIDAVYEPGSVIAGKYRVEHLLGQGGMGIVVAAEHADLRTKVALKFLSEECAGNAVVVERFLREARACARLRSEHVCRVFDVGRLETGVPFLVMELLDGVDLARALVQYGPLDPATAAAYVIQACDAIAEAHDAGIVHRDLKPANLFLVRRADQRPLIKVLDFGIAKAQSDRDSAITHTETVIGSPSYMAPEQLRSARHADARSDIWSLGVVLAEMTSGIRPFEGESTIDLALQIMQQPARLSPTMAPALLMVIERCLRKDPAERYQRVTELQAALAPVTHDMSSTPRPMRFPTPIPATGPDPYSATTLGSASGVVHGTRLRSRGVVMGVAAVVALAAGFGVSQLVRGTRSAPTAQPLPTPPAPVPPQPAPVPMPVVAPPDAAVAAVPVDAASPPARPPPPKHLPLRHQKTKEELGESRK